MTRIFDITTASDLLNIDASGQGKLLFTVTNTTQRPQRASLRLRVLDSGEASWLKLGGESERDFPPGFTHQVEVAVSPPAGSLPGKFRVRLDALSVANPDDDFTEGPAVGVIIPTPSIPPKKSMLWLWLLIAAVVLTVIAAVIFLVMRKPPVPDKPPVPVPPTVPVPPPAPTTKDFNGPTLSVGGRQVPLDYCREWSANCGQAAANAFCVKEGFARALDFSIKPNSPPTVVISSMTVCDVPMCTKIASVKCTSQPLRLVPSVIRPEILQQIRPEIVRPLRPDAPR